MTDTDRATPPPAATTTNPHAASPPGAAPPPPATPRSASSSPGAPAPANVSPPPAPAPPPPPKKSGCGGCLGGCFIVLLLGLFSCCGSTALVWWLYRTPPAHFIAQQKWLQNTPEPELERRAQTTEQVTANSLQAPRSAGGLSAGSRPASEVRTLELQVHDINAWLQQRMPQWLANQGFQWPSAVQYPTFAVVSGRPTLSVETDLPMVGRQILSADFDLALLPSGDLRCALHSVSIGRLPVPVTRVYDFVRSQINVQGGGLATFEQVVLHGQTLRPEFRADARTLIRLSEVNLTPDRIRLSVEASYDPTQSPR